MTNHTGSATHSWTVQFDIHESTLTSQWCANYSNDGSSYTATNAAWNGNIPSAQNFGFCANKTGTNWRPELVSATIE